tara:strand:- start:118 stop:333 length:216 start_codon:yes stop_codon:yes gene_type:complete
VTKKVKSKIKKFILAGNYTIVVVICLILLTQTQIPIIERAVYGFGAIFLGIVLRRMINACMRLDEEDINRK